MAWELGVRGLQEERAPAARGSAVRSCKRSRHLPGTLQAGLRLGQTEMALGTSPMPCNTLSSSFLSEMVLLSVPLL